uniref:Uncharacterized protein n=1 Tax=Anguilla anguilla TaxID=7936 RepID=A0A0E9SUN9_ANGAN
MPFLLPWLSGDPKAVQRDLKPHLFSELVFV